MVFNEIAIIGLGLLGGSLCRALKEINPGVKISAYGRSPSKLEPALRDGNVDFIDTIENISLKGKDLIIVCSPVISSIDILKKILNDPELERSALVIDVGSVKGDIVKAIESLARADRFIGCHPMAGSEKTGYENSTADLYDGAYVFITPGKLNSDRDIKKIETFWKELKARTLVLSPEEHDMRVTYTSHLPHIIACMVVRLFQNIREKSLSGEDMLSFLGSGFRDVTRIASGSPDMWHDIISLNTDNIHNSIGEFIDELKKFQAMIPPGGGNSAEVHDFFNRVKKIKEGLS